MEPDIKNLDIKSKCIYRGIGELPKKTFHLHFSMCFHTDVAITTKKKKKTNKNRKHQTIVKENNLISRIATLLDSNFLFLAEKICKTYTERKKGPFDGKG